MTGHLTARHKGGSLPCPSLQSIHQVYELPVHYTMPVQHEPYAVLFNIDSKHHLKVYYYMSFLSIETEGALC